MVYGNHRCVSGYGIGDDELRDHKKNHNCSNGIYPFVEFAFSFPAIELIGVTHRMFLMHLVRFS
ncbi:MAG: hypothetical protein ACOH2V_13015 [Candidatus Saccharimonadaceae bacterium]